MGDKSLVDNTQRIEQKSKGWVIQLIPDDYCFEGDYLKVKPGNNNKFSLNSFNGLAQRNLVDPASNHMLVLKIKPCMSKYKPPWGETADGSLNRLEST